jgi:hypothetical protein
MKETNLQAQLRADNFCHARAIAEIKTLNEILRKNVAEDVMKKVEGQILQSYSRENNEFHRSLLRFLSRVTDGKVWDEAVDAVIYAAHGHKIDRQDYVRQRNSASGKEGVNG